MKETQAMHGKTSYESEVCVKGNGDNTNLSATSFCLNICKQESCIGERLLTH